MKEPTIHSTASLQATAQASAKPKPGPEAGPGRARYIMIGGFLGAGKTTSVLRLAHDLQAQGLRVGLITNDQGADLVDTALLRSRGFATEEIAGGCFCCRFNSLAEAAERLRAEAAPDVFIAEPVGSCTDLVATVSYPLRRLYGGRFSIAPLSVVVDPIRAMRVFGLRPGPSFSDKVVYIYRKQLEEADLVVINKIDLLDPAALESLHSALKRELPRAEIHPISARQGTGLAAWFGRLGQAELPARSAMEINYDLYAEGEALLGWLNATVELKAADEFEANRLLSWLAGRLRDLLTVEGAEIAHLKMTFSPHDGLGGIAVINLVRNDVVPEQSILLEEAAAAGQLLVNIRAECAPEVLGRVLETVLGEVPAHWPGLRAELEHIEQFRPGRPTPTHRLAGALVELTHQQP